MPEKAKDDIKARKPETKPAAGARPAGTKPAGQKTAAAKPAGQKTAGTKRAGQKAGGTKRAGRRLERVPEQYVFYCCDGSIYRDLEELAAGLAAMTDDAFYYHSNAEKQDFCNWVRDIIEDVELAEDLAMAVNRLEAADRVAERIAFLSE
jgi:hypothetical protein